MILGRPIHVKRMKKELIDIGTWNVNTVLKRWKPMSKRPIGRPKLRWENDVLEDIKSMNVRNWKNCSTEQK